MLCAHFRKVWPFRDEGHSARIAIIVPLYRP